MRVTCGRRTVQVLVVPALALLACASPPPPQLAVRWEPCTPRTSNAEPAECATVEVPAHWESRDNAKVSLAVRRFHPPGVTARGQLWLLQGGPGAAVPSFDGAGPYFARLGLDLDIYLVDQRGTGDSSRLGCAEQEAATSPGGTAIIDTEWSACLEALAHQPAPLTRMRPLTSTRRRRPPASSGPPTSGRLTATSLSR